jgi:hypothetical protein
MAFGTRAGAVLPLVGAVAAAAALAGAAVFTVSQAGCADPGRYVPANGQLHLVGGCVDTSDLTPAANQPGTDPGDGQQSKP